jgi:hypothetical protein
MTFEELFEDQAKGEIAKRIRGIDALKILFGAGDDGVNRAFESLLWNGTIIFDPIDHDTAIKYHELARRAIIAGHDPYDVQMRRMQLMEHALKYKVSL